MSQGYAAITNPPVGISGNQYTTLLNTNLAALVSMNSGPTAPTDPVTYMNWMDTSTTPYTHKIYDGNDWIIAGYFDAVNNQYTYAFRATNSQTGISYSIDATDRDRLINFNNNSAVAITLPQAGSTFPSGWSVRIRNSGTGTITITPTTSTINGGSSISLKTGQSCQVISDGTNYFTIGDLVIPPKTITSVEESDDAWTDVASTALIDLGSITSRNVNIAGTSTITSFGTSPAGRRKYCKLASGLILTKSSDLILPAGGDIAGAAGDSFTAISMGSGKWLVTGYTKADGYPLTSGVTGRLVALKTITDTSDYIIPNDGSVSYIIVYVIGGGGGAGFGYGGGSIFAVGGSGGGGGCAIMKIPLADLLAVGATIPCIVGAGGLAGTNASGSGGNGGSSSFGEFCSATGGGGGPFNSGNASGQNIIAPGGIGVGGDINLGGDPGSLMSRNYDAGGGTSTLPGGRAAGPYGGPGAPGVGRGNTGRAASANSGGGGSGGMSATYNNASADIAGGAGGSGLIVIEEYN